MSTIRDWLEGKEAKRKLWPVAGVLVLMLIAFLAGRRTAPEIQAIDYANLDTRIADMQATLEALPKQQTTPSTTTTVRLFGSIKEQWTNARETPSAEARIMHTYDAGELVEIHDQRDGWVLSGDGWIRETLVEF